MLFLEKHIKYFHPARPSHGIDVSVCVSAPPTFWIPWTLRCLLDLGP